MQCSFFKRTQRIFKCGDIQNISFTPDKELNIFIYWTPSYFIIYRGHNTFKKGPVFIGLPCIMPLTANTNSRLKKLGISVQHVEWSPVYDSRAFVVFV